MTAIGAPETRGQWIRKSNASFCSTDLRWFCPVECLKYHLAFLSGDFWRCSRGCWMCQKTTPGGASDTCEISDRNAEFVDQVAFAVDRHDKARQLYGRVFMIPCKRAASQSAPSDARRWIDGCCLMRRAQRAPKNFLRLCAYTGRKRNQTTRDDCMFQKGRVKAHIRIPENECRCSKTRRNYQVIPLPGRTEPRDYRTRSSDDNRAFLVASSAAVKNKFAPASVLNNADGAERTSLELSHDGAKHQIALTSLASTLARD